MAGVNALSVSTFAQAAATRTQPGVDGSTPTAREGSAPTPPAGDLFEEMRAELRQRVDALGARVHEALPSPDAGTSTLLDRLDTLSHDIDRANADAVKRQMREALWNLRQGLQAGPPQGSSLEVRTALEKVRQVCFDAISDRLGSWPSSHTVVRPRLSDVPNYEVVTPTFWRGGQPDTDGAAWLAAHGVTSEVDLRGTDQGNQWVPPQWANVRHYMIPVEDNHAPTFEQVEEFVKTMDSAKEPVFVHCKAGIGRTGTMVACWRITRGWTADQALEAEHTFSGKNLYQSDFVRAFERWWRERPAPDPPST